MKEDKLNTQEKDADLPGYPEYPANEDIYINEIKEEDKNPENIAELKTVSDITGDLNEKDFEVDETGDDLDIPGAELDDFQENIGSEDEENNYYSIGGDNHNSLDEDNGD